MAELRVSYAGRHMVLEGTNEQMRRVRRTLASWETNYAREITKWGRPKGTVSPYSREDMADARAWAREVGIDVAMRGPVSHEVMAAWKGDQGANS